MAMFYILTFITFNQIFGRMYYRLYPPLPSGKFSEKPAVFARTGEPSRDASRVFRVLTCLSNLVFCI